WQGGADQQVRKHDAGRAVAALLPVEGQLDGNALTNPDHIGAVPAANGNGCALHAALDFGVPCLARAEEEPAEPGYGSRSYQDDDRHAYLPRLFSIPPQGILVGLARGGGSGVRLRREQGRVPQAAAAHRGPGTRVAAD